MGGSRIAYGLSALALFSVFIIVRWLYRLTLHPLSKFPGPKAAALSSVFAMWYDIPTKTSYIKKFPKWHDEYGPIIRIEPNHLHIRDIDTCHEVHKVGSRFDKDPALYSFPLTKGSIMNVLSNKKARGHRDMYAKYFSRSAVIDLESVVKGNLGKLMKRFHQLSVDDEVIDLHRAFRCLTADTILRYIFNNSFNALDQPEFKHELIDPMEDFMSDWTFTLSWYFPNFMNAVAGMCIRWPRLGKANKSFRSALQGAEFCAQQAVKFRAKEKSSGRHIFNAPLNPDTAKGHPILDDGELARDTWTLFFAGTDTSASTLVRGFWHLLKDPSKMNTLQAELKHVLPLCTEVDTMSLGWAELEKLVYLRAVIKESLRLYYGVPGKNPRVVPPEGAILCGQFIPGGTVISMSAYSYHHYSHYWTSYPHEEFHPERWLDREAAEWQDSVMFPFGKGARQCLGRNLAMATLYMSFAYILRNFEFEICGTTDHDMEWHDGLLPMTFGHLKVKARQMSD